LADKKARYDRCLFYTSHGRWNQVLGISSLLLQRLTLGSSRTGNNLDKFASNDGLTGSVVENLELVDHVSGVLGSVVHGVLTRRLLASVTLSQRPEERVGESVLAEVGENLVLDLERGEVG
jgi:hypothetical protein